jgi:hypothetical protein
MATTPPSIGRIVHYTNLGDAEGRYPPEQHPAIITKVGDRPGYATVSLCILYTTGLFFMDDVPYAEAPERGHWSWPPRV